MGAVVEGKKHKVHGGEGKSGVRVRVRIKHTSLVGAVITGIRVIVFEKKRTQQRTLDEDMTVIAVASVEGCVWLEVRTMRPACIEF